VPYQLAQYWDNKARSAPTTRSKSSRGDKSETQSTVGHVPRDLRATAKRTPAVKSWLRVLEEPVRQFVVERGLLAASVKEKIVSNDNKRPSDESEGGDEDEIVFKGRRELRRGSAGASVHEGSSKLTQQQGALSSEQGVGHQLVENGMVLETEDDASGAFKCVFFLTPTYPLCLVTRVFYSPTFPGAGLRTQSRITTALIPSPSQSATLRAGSCTSASNRSRVHAASPRPVGLFFRPRCGKCSNGRADLGGRLLLFVAGSF